MHVAMILGNDFTRDNRVRREAHALAEAGHQVTLHAVLTDDTEPEEDDGSAEAVSTAEESPELQDSAVAQVEVRQRGLGTEGDDIPGALPFVATGAITAEYPSGWFGSLRVRYFDGAPLVEDGSVEGQGSTMANLAFGWGNERWRLQADVLNLFDSDDRDIEYFYASRLPGEPADGVEDIHYHVFEPRQVRVYASLLF